MINQSRIGKLTYPLGTLRKLNVHKVFSLRLVSRENFKQHNDLSKVWKCWQCAGSCYRSLHLSLGGPTWKQLFFWPPSSWSYEILFEERKCKKPFLDQICYFRQIRFDRNQYSVIRSIHGPLPSRKTPDLINIFREYVRIIFVTNLAGQL